MFNPKCETLLYLLILIIMYSTPSSEELLATEDQNVPAWIRILCNVRSRWSDLSQIIVVSSSDSVFQSAVHVCFATPIILRTKDTTNRVLPVNSQKEAALVLVEDDNITWLTESLSLLPKHPDLRITIALLFSPANKTVFETVIAALWHEEFINAVILHFPSDSQHALFYRYYPYSENCNVPGSAMLIAESSTGLSLPETVYAEYKLVDLKGCSVRTAIMSAKLEPGQTVRDKITKLPGLFGETVERHLNFRLHMVFPRDMRGWGDFLPNGTYFGILGDLYTHWVDIGLNDFSLSSNRYRISDLINPYREDCLTALVLKGMGKPPSIWAVLFKEYSPEMWLLIGATIISVSALVTYIRNIAAKMLSSTSSFTSFGKSLFYFFQTLLGAPSLFRPRTTAARYFFGSWFLFSMVLSTGYMAAFTGLVTVPWSPKDIETLSELVESGLKVFSHHTLLVYLADEDPKSPEAIIAKTAFTNHLPWIQTLHNMSKYRDRAAVYPEFAMKTMLADMDPNLAEEFHLFKDFCVSRTMVSPMVTRKGSPLTRALDDAVQRVLESGLVDYWLRALPLGRRQEIRAVEPFSLRNVISAFVVHAIGLTVSTIVFIIEKMLFSKANDSAKLIKKEKRKSVIKKFNKSS